MVVRTLVALSSLAIAVGCTKPQPPAPSPASSEHKDSRCPFWGGRSYKVTVHRSTSHGHHFRDLSYDDATGVVLVHDSDIFAPGASADAPRVIERDMTLTAAQRDALDTELRAACPTAEEAEPSEPSGGGQIKLEVKGPDGSVRRAVFVPNKGSEAAHKTLLRLSRFFPDLRADADAGDAGVSSCTPWRSRGFVAIARLQDAHADSFRDLGYDDRKGVVSMRVSRPAKTEGAKPEVIERSVTLSNADRDALAADLANICPDEKALSAKCAPGGCTSLSVTSGGSKVVVEDLNTVDRVMQRLRKFFPDAAPSASTSSSVNATKGIACGATTCTAPEQCITVSGKSGKSRLECWILCAADPKLCPSGTSCRMIYDGPGHVCVKK